MHLEQLYISLMCVFNIYISTMCVSVCSEANVDVEPSQTKVLSSFLSFFFFLKEVQMNFKDQKAWGESVPGM